MTRKARKTKTHGPTTKTVAANVRRLRENQGLTRRDLEARTRTDPHDESSALVTVEMLRGIENSADPAPGKTVRRVDADDLVALALALGVNPNALLLPPTVNGTIELTGHGEVPAEYAWAWADGRRPLSLNPDDTETYEFLARTRPRRTTPPGY